MSLYYNAKNYEGIEELPGRDENNDVITAWLKLCLPDRYLSAGKFDETSWCSAFVHGVFIETYGWQAWERFVKSKDINSLAKSWKRANEGFIEVQLNEAEKGDIVILDRGTKSWQGHIGFFDSRDGNHVRILGGNQSNTVNVGRYPVWKIENILRVEINENLI